MGKFKGKKHDRKGDSTDGTISVKKSTQRWDSLPETNEAFVNYYKAQGIVANEEEWNELFSILRTDLPTTFRITGGRKNSTYLNKLIQETYVPFLSRVAIGGEQVPPPKQISWYPGGLAWELCAPKQVVRKAPEFKKFQNFLVYETEAGNLSRQEAVSMIPPLLLNVEPHHYILDACAAPGSKTAQLVESLQSDSSSVIPTGLLIANDSDYKRSHMLVHQALRRLPSPSTMITNHDASMFPSLKFDGARLMFDRILCDVPCTGDGTLRKNGGIWRDWTTANGIGLHGLQLRILTRCISLLKPGGRMVYSTCSLNPLENEAVVSAALSQHPEMSLLDVSDSLPELIRRPGMTTWKVMGRQGPATTEFQSYDDVNDSQGKAKYSTTLWPDGQESAKGLQHCLRIYPHLQNTGGFFVAVLIKAENASMEDNPIDNPRLAVKRSADKLVDQVPSENSESKKPKIEGDIDVPTIEEGKVATESVQTSVNQASEAEKVKAKPSGQKFNSRGFQEEPYTYIKPGNEEVKKCLEFFGFNSSFPADNLLVRNASGTPTRSIYLTTSAVRRVIESNSHDRLRLICCGVKLFGKDNSNSVAAEGAAYECKWRVVSDGVEFCRPFMGTNRIFQCSLSSLRQLISNGEQYPLFGDLEEPFRKVVESIEPGSCVMEIVGESGEQVPQGLMVAMWISKASVNLMVDKKERKVLSLRLWGEDLTLTNTNGKTIKKEDVVQNRETEKSKVKEDVIENGKEHDKVEEVGILVADGN
ncbi:hypothetical protein CROQUDRAFT_658860 [Cronartium quercuum f. sp. fusiforme G11]|uniref:SAM-dependent MTase RsmB/NOP-type domain-containing protein n=1 Tax=Cronartium quercuum f. sp. fusiforme G11 TaxID=708437 RepID=A0A9P6NG03_9BASI|nr:hypothetical protein CROQUDRAFT_658860 [Cronartium quercuum f. sp. fusiforme G11]